MTGNETAVAVRGLSLTYRAGWLGRRRLSALAGVDLDVAGGETLGLVGPNGSGKSSLLRCLLGLEPGRATRCDVLGYGAGNGAALRQIGHIAEGRLPFGRLTARELLTLCGTLARWPLAAARQRAAELLERVGLTAAAERPHEEFSAGMERRLALAQALFHQPKLLLLDEPTTGMDPLAVVLLRDELAAHAARGGAAIVATHALEELCESFDRLCVLRAGSVIAAGTPEQVLGESGTLEITLEGVDQADLPHLLAQITAAGARVRSSRPARRTLGSLFAAFGRQAR